MFRFHTDSDNIDALISRYYTDFETLTKKELYPDEKAPDSDKIKKELKAKIKKEFYKFNPELKLHVQAFVKVLKTRKKIEDYTRGELVGARFSREVCLAIYRKYGLIKEKIVPSSETEEVENSSEHVNGSFFSQYEKLASYHDILPPDNILSFLCGLGKSTVGNCRYKLKEKGFEFESYKVENENFWRVIKRPQSKSNAELFIESLSEEQRQLFTKVLG